MTNHHQTPKPCPVESGEECAMPDRRKWSSDYTINFPSLLAILGLALTLGGALILNDRRQTVAEEQIKLQAVISKGITDHATTMEQLSARDRIEIRDDIKEIKETVNKIADVQRRR